MTRILFKFIIYPTWGKASKNMRVKSKIVRKSSFRDMIFLTSHDYIWFLFICFLYCAKEGIVVEISKVSQPLEKWLPLCKVVENARINISVSPYCTLLFSKRKPQIFGSSLISCLQWHGWLHYEYVRISALNTILDIYLLFENGCKTLKQGVKFIQTKA